MIAVWHAALPQTPLAAAGALQSVSNRIEFSPDVGPPMARQRTTLAQTIIPWSFMLTAGQVSLFREFYDVTLKGGAARFSAIDPFKGDVAEFKFMGDYSIEYFAPNVWRLTSSIRRVS